MSSSNPQKFSVLSLAPEVDVSDTANPSLSLSNTIAGASTNTSETKSQGRDDHDQDSDNRQLRLAIISLTEQFREHQQEFEEYKIAHPVHDQQQQIPIPVPIPGVAAYVEPNALAGQMKARITPPTIFYGKPYIMGSNEPTIDEWLEYVERYMDVTGISDAARCDFAMFYLGGAALSLIQSQRMMRTAASEGGSVAEEVGFWTWKWLKQKLKKQYQPFNKSQVIRDQLNRLRQGNDSLNGYLQAFIQLSAQIGIYSQLTPDGLTDNEKLAYFRRGLNANLGLEIDKADGAMTYERATGLAAKIESAVNTLANSKGPAFSNTLGKTLVVSKGKFTSATSQPVARANKGTKKGFSKKWARSRQNG